MHFLMYCRKLELIMANIKLLKSLPRPCTIVHMYMYFIINGSYFITFSDAYTCTCTCSKF